MSKLNEVAVREELVDLTRLFNFATFDTMAQLCFGQSLGLLEKGGFSPWVRSIFESLRMLPMVSFIAYYPLLNSIFTRFEPKFVTEQREMHCRHSAERVNTRLEEGSDQPDIWNLVMSAQENGHRLTIKEMHSNAELFMLAGSETTGWLLLGSLDVLMLTCYYASYLTERRHVLFAYQSEAKQASDDGSPISVPDCRRYDV